MTHPTALELRDRLRSGETSSRELTEESLQRALDQRDLGAFVSLDAEHALEAADRADRALERAGVDERLGLSPLLGLPTAHKDLVRSRGLVTTHGSAAVPHVRANDDDPIARTVRAAGAICIGKTQVPEFGIAGYSENLIAPPARNPFDADRTAGGSSGGTATAVAGGVLAAAIGSDAGGSIRIPSAACGLIGLKPGRGVVPADAQGGLIDERGVPRMAVSGPMARTASDAALLYDAILGRHDEPSLAAVHRTEELRGLRIGVSFDSPFEAAMPIRFDEAAHAAVQLAVSTLEAAGHLVEEAAIDYGEHYADAFTTVWTQGLRRVPLSPADEDRLGNLARWFLERARGTGERELALRIGQLRDFAHSATEQWSVYDAVLTPALAFGPPAIGEFWARGPEGDYRLQCEWAPQTSMVNVVGAPAIAVPVTVDSRGMPRGVQLIGRTGSEIRLLQLAEQLSA